MITLHKVGYVVFLYHFAVNAYAFAEIDKMWRRVQSRAVAGCLERCGYGVGCCAFAVCASYVYAAEAFVRVAEHFGQHEGVFQSRTVGSGAYGVECRKVAVYVMQGGCVAFVHGCIRKDA